MLAQLQATFGLRKPNRRRRGSTGSVIVRSGVYYGKWRDSDGRQVMKRLGLVRPGGTRGGLTQVQAEAQLRRLMSDTVDQMQYLAWAQDASRHFLVSDLSVLRASAHDYLQPMVTISGGLVALGMAPWLALLVWKPVVLIAIFMALRACYHRVLAGRAERRAAVALGLFAAGWASLGEEWIPSLSWGYLYALAALAALVGALVAYDRARVLGHGIWQAPVLGLLASWLHPWQGELLILVIAGVEAAGVRTRFGNRKRIIAGGDHDRHGAPADLLRDPSALRLSPGFAGDGSRCRCA